MKTRFMVAAVFLVSGAAQAHNAGCGLGSRIFKGNGYFSNQRAMWVNGYSSSQNSSITSGTSDCRTNGLVRRDKLEIFYAETHLDRLAIEMAQGEGESLLAFAEVLGCDDSSVPGFAKMTQREYGKIFPTPDTGSEAMLRAVHEGIAQDAGLSAGCGSPVI